MHGRSCGSSRAPKARSPRVGPWRPTTRCSRPRPPRRSVRGCSSRVYWRASRWRAWATSSSPASGRAGPAWP
jgi:hypothetical protein